ncbi:hypothetical protein STEG23_034637, partial [Scotinomys teguina]
MLTGAGQYADLAAQIRYDPAAYAQISVAATRAWKALPNKASGEQLSKVIQGPSEPFSEFVDRLLQLPGKIFGNADQAMPIQEPLQQTATGGHQLQRGPWYVGKSSPLAYGKAQIPSWCGPEELFVFFPRMEKFLSGSLSTVFALWMLLGHIQMETLVGNPQLLPSSSYGENKRFAKLSHLSTTPDPGKWKEPIGLSTSVQGCPLQ